MGHFARDLGGVIVACALASIVHASCSSSADSGPHELTGKATSGGAGGGGASSTAGGGGYGGAKGAGGAGGSMSTSSSASSSASSSSSSGAGGAAPTCAPAGPQDCSPSQVAIYQCLDLPTNFNKQVNAAVETVLAAHPSWFDYGQGFPCCPLVLEPNLYMDAVVTEIHAAGLCAARDPNNPDIEAAVKLDGSCDEGYALLTSGNIARHPPHYQGSCVPAWL